MTKDITLMIRLLHKTAFITAVRVSPVDHEEERCYDVDRQVNGKGTGQGTTGDLCKVEDLSSINTTKWIFPITTLENHKFQKEMQPG